MRGDRLGSGNCGCCLPGASGGVVGIHYRKFAADRFRLAAISVAGAGSDGLGVGEGVQSDVALPFQKIDPVGVGVVHVAVAVGDDSS